MLGVEKNLLGCRCSSLESTEAGVHRVAEQQEAGVATLATMQKIRPNRSLHLDRGRAKKIGKIIASSDDDKGRLR